MLALLQVPFIHFDWTLNVKDVTLILLFLYIIKKGLPVYQLLTALASEHRLLIQDYADRHGMTVEEVQTTAITRLRSEAGRRSAKAGK